MFKNKPDYRILVAAARNYKTRYIPMYEHDVSDKMMEKILGKKFVNLYEGNNSDRREYYRIFNSFFEKMGYDAVFYSRGYPLVMPGSGALRKNTPGVIKNREDFERYPWDKIPALYFKRFYNDYMMLGEQMPSGMMAVGGPGFGVFEGVEDLTGYQELCMIKADDPELFSSLFVKIGEVMYKIWSEFLKHFGDIFCACRIGDDLGFKSSTLLSPEDIRTHIVPQHKRLIELIHSYNKPFILHSCGNVFPVMEDFIGIGIDAKHSNEDAISPFSCWVELYGDRIGNFGGIDMDYLCSKSEAEVKEIVTEVLKIKPKGGFAIGSGNSISDYVKPELYLAMIETVLEQRRE